MVKGQTKNGMAIGERGNEALSTDVVKILKSQDAGYVRVQIAKDEKVSFLHLSIVEQADDVEDRQVETRVGSFFSYWTWKRG
jgi:hypothetical protein